MRVIQSLRNLLPFGKGAVISVTALASLLVLNVAHAQLLDPYTAKYKAYRSGSEVGHAEMHLESLGDKRFKVSFTSKASLFFFSDKREEVSLFSNENNALIPYKYTFKLDSTFKDSALALEFNQDKKLIYMSGNQSMEWQGELDNQLYMLASQKALKEGKTDFEFDVINYRGQKRHYKFKVNGEEMLDLPYGKLKTIKVETIRDNKKRQTYTWFAPELNYLLVRIQQFKDGDEQGDIQLSKFILDAPEPEKAPSSKSPESKPSGNAE
ncbi:DUF3108 domain-containing protein [Paraneptunicella aestuarii]|uniref:DUF3108 domain-containing protein n=1 Tax=Paraneptunicella aestuarii TaxID=2831148 RepID=UPI001E47DCA2|nr:DUF3108 domain-containing protein [Paraneptunicella aestuarii]UAA40330.1 DUF3108 domain-containing protein [Paraneptunicella aestuarii]